MVPRIKKEATISQPFFLNDVRFVFYDAKNNRIAGRSATISEIAAHRDCPYIIEAYGKRMFTDLSVAQRLLSALKLKPNLSPTEKNIEEINEALKQSEKKKTFFLSLVNGISSSNEQFEEILIMDMLDPRKIQKETNGTKEETEEEYDR